MEQFWYDVSWLLLIVGVIGTIIFTIATVSVMDEKRARTDVLIYAGVTMFFVTLALLGWGAPKPFEPPLTATQQLEKEIDHCLTYAVDGQGKCLESVEQKYVLLNKFKGIINEPTTNTRPANENNLRRTDEWKVKPVSGEAGKGETVPRSGTSG